MPMKTYPLQRLLILSVLLFLFGACQSAVMTDLPELFDRLLTASEGAGSTDDL